MKVLSDLLQEVTYKKHCILQGLSITGIQYDSRKVALGNLFVAIKGFQSDGHQYPAGLGAGCDCCYDFG